MKLILAILLVTFAVACGQADKTFTVPVRLNAGFYVGADPTLWLTLPTGGSSVTWATLPGKPTFAAVATSGLFSDLLSRPTTLAGYGITDAALSTHVHTFASLTSKPTTLSGYGITDAALATHTHAFTSITGRPTTLAGYGITDAALATHNHDLLYKPISYVATYAGLPDKPESVELADAILSLQGIKLPVLTTTQINALTPVVGLLVYDSTLNVLKIYVGTWKVIITAN